MTPLYLDLATATTTQAFAIYVFWSLVINVVGFARSRHKRRRGSSTPTLHPPIAAGTWWWCVVWQKEVSLSSNMTPPALLCLAAASTKSFYAARRGPRGDGALQGRNARRNCLLLNTAPPARRDGRSRKPVLRLHIRY